VLAALSSIVKCVPEFGGRPKRPGRIKRLGILFSIRLRQPTMGRCGGDRH
jgi:hypothetical protein